ncbi:MAG: hypothetical protein ABJ308_02145 [Halieaceae bacterium]
MTKLVAKKENLHGSDVEKIFDFSYREACASHATQVLGSKHRLHGKANFFNMLISLVSSSSILPSSAVGAEPPEYYPTGSDAYSPQPKGFGSQRSPNNSLMRTELKNALPHSSIRYVP